MSDPAQHNPPRRAQRIALLIAAGAIGFVIAASFDGWVSRSIDVDGARSKDWGRALRVLGYWPLWLLVGAIFIIHDGRITLRPPLRDRFTRGVLVALSSGAAGLLAELCKLIVRRLRPGEGETIWTLRPFSEEPFNTSGLAMPSSHSAVAFGAAFMLMRLHPGAGLWWLAVGIGCGAQRVLSHAHFVSDVYVAALLGYACSGMLWGHAHACSAARSNRA